MKPDIFRNYPLVKKFLDQDRAMFGAPEPELKKQQERAIELIEAEGGGSKEEKEVSMICAAIILSPMSLYADVGRFWEGYNDEVTTMVQAMLSTAPGSFMSAPIAQGTAAAGIAQMEGVEQSVKTGKPPLTGSYQEVLEGVKQAFGQEMEVFSYLDAPQLLARYEITRDHIFAELEAKVRPAQPPKRPAKPGNGSFDF
ncbi:MAG: hypothetical protein ACAH83_16375 [Alphaproteobacteria bacterium]